MSMQNKLSDNDQQLMIAFIQGVRWWEYQRTRCTLWQSDAIEAETEARRRLENRTLGKDPYEVMQVAQDAQDAEEEKEPEMSESVKDFFERFRKIRENASGGPC